MRSRSRDETRVTRDEKNQEGRCDGVVRRVKTHDERCDELYDERRDQRCHDRRDKADVTRDVTRGMDVTRDVRGES